METYKASDSLAQIFLTNGFHETTSSRFPEHQNRIEEKGYNPDQSKRSFSFKNNAAIIFNYIRINVYHNGGSSGKDSNMQFSENEIKSIIAFFKLPPQTRNAYKRKGSDIVSLYEHYFYIKSHPEYKKSSNRYIVEAIESVII